MLLLLRGGIVVLWFGFSEPNALMPAAGDVTRVITDTAGYCVQLRTTIEDLMRQAPVPPPLGVAVLSEQGARMCEEGFVRGGLIRLRRALIMLREAQGGGGG